MRRLAALALLLGSAPATAQTEAPERDYRSGPAYPPLVMHRTDRVIRGGDGRLYCRRADGSSGLIGGAIAGVAITALERGQSRTLGALLSGAVGMAIGQSVDRGEVTCR